MRSLFVFLALSVFARPLVAQPLPGPSPEVEPTFDEASAEPAPEPEPPNEAPPPAAPAAAPTAAATVAAEPGPAPEVEPESPAAPDKPDGPNKPHGPDKPAPSATPDGEKIVTWLDPSASDPAADWLQLSSGEWLKGTVNRMREGVVDFSSASVGNQSIGWSTIVQMRTAQRLIFVRVDRTTATGTSSLVDGQLLVTTEHGPRTMPQDEVLSIVAAKPSEWQRWAFLLSFGLASRSGNTDSLNATAFSRLSRVDAYNRLVFEYSGAFGLLAGVPNTHKHRGTGVWDLFVSPRIYLTPLSADALYDEFQNLALRWTAATGFGARTIRLSKFSLKTDLATGFLQNNYVSVLAGNPSQTQGLFVRPGIQINGGISSAFTYELQWQTSFVVTNPAYTFHRGAARLSLAVFGNLTVDWSAIYDRQETTVTAADGITPKRDDLVLTAGIGLDFH